MQDPAANTAPGRCDDDEVGGDEGGIDRSRAVCLHHRPPEALPPCSATYQQTPDLTPTP